MIRYYLGTVFATVTLGVSHYPFRNDASHMNL
jgi:hypothetical protein